MGFTVEATIRSNPKDRQEGSRVVAGISIVYRCVGDSNTSLARSTAMVTMYPMADIELAKRLEGTEAAANLAYVEARARLDPKVGATHMRMQRYGGRI